MERLEVLKDGLRSKVYLVYDHVNRRMAVEKRLYGEIAVYRQLQTLSHPYLPELYSVQFSGTETVILEEYIPGGSPAQAGASEKQVVRWLFELCEVLSYLHKHNILHRDIKPSNLLIGKDGHIRLIDFDSARIEKPTANSDTRLLGTRGYAPPEQYGFSQTDERTDVYALGVTFREFLGSVAKKRRWKHILRRCTALEPKRRFRHASQIRWAFLADRIFHRVILPILFFIVALNLGFVIWSYTSSTDFREAINVVLSSRRSAIFCTVDISTLKSSDVRLNAFTGDQVAAYHQLAPFVTDRFLIFTGYSDENGQPLFGGFSVRYYVTTGELFYDCFEGLYTLNADYTVTHIPPENCASYASAVLALYQLDTFDTPFF